MFQVVMCSQRLGAGVSSYEVFTEAGAGVSSYEVFTEAWSRCLKL